MTYHYVDDSIQEKIHFSTTPGNVLSANGQKILSGKAHYGVIKCSDFPSSTITPFKDIN